MKNPNKAISQAWKYYFMSFLLAEPLPECYFNQFVEILLLPIILLYKDKCILGP